MGLLLEGTREIVKEISIVVPVKDEQETIGALVEAIHDVFNSSLQHVGQLNEIIIVDDGSGDRTWSAIEKAVDEWSSVVGVRLRRNFGKAAALQEGILHSTGGVIITMDGDMQDDPAEIPRFLEAMERGFDLVSGWKQVRHDPLGKTLPSKLFNWVTAAVTGIRIHDFNCGFKAYDRRVFDHVILYGELHRFVPALAHSEGYRVAEIAVTHHPRRFGRSKYGLKRLFKGFLDLLTVLTVTRFRRRPGHLFGSLGLTMGLIGASMLAYLTVIWFQGQSIGDRPLLIISALFIIVGVQLVVFGMVAELIIHASGKPQVALAAEVRRHKSGVVGGGPQHPVDKSRVASGPTSV